jgi:hypothetical protein
MMNNSRQTTRLGMVLYPAAALSLVAGLVGLRVVPYHFEEWWVFGAFFLVTALVQSLYGTVLLLWPTASVFLFGLLGNAASVLTYLVVRSPSVEGTTSPLDALMVVSGVSLVAALGWLLASRLRSYRRAVVLVPNLNRTARSS